jgi:pyruvate formate lyase activating enzyme
VLWSLVWGRPCSVNIDPIEKKPLYHVLPGTGTLSIATVGCVLTCKFCQNWQISQGRPEEARAYHLPPLEVAKAALYYRTPSITYTYTEPTVFYEYMLECAQAARAVGLRNFMHTCGYINLQPLRQLSQWLDAANVDLKAMSEDFYQRICGGTLRPVLQCILELRRLGVWVEITNLVIPTLNDSDRLLKALARWIRAELGPEVPLHLSRFFPYYKLRNLPPTPEQTLWRAREIALSEGLKYVYLGNLRSRAEHTYCGRCGRLLIERLGYRVRRNLLRESRCPFCGQQVPGLWA